MKLEIKFEKYPVLSTGKESNHLLVRLKTPANAMTQRPPLVIGLAIDKSWSMKGEKMDSTIEAASYLVNWLTRNDYVAIIAYSADVQIIQPLTKLTDKGMIVDKLRSIQVGTSTNLSGGWLQTLRAVESAPIPNSYRRLILLTDGQATLGIKDPAQLKKIAADHLGRNISTTAIGVGDDFSEETLREISVAGGGNFYFIANPEEAPEIFFKEFGDIGALYGQAVEIKITFPEGLNFVELLNDIPYTLDGNVLTIQAGDVRSDDIRNFVINCETDPAKIAKAGALASVDVSYYNILQNMSFETVKGNIDQKLAAKSSAFDPDVLTETLISRSAKAMIEASRFSAGKNPDAAKEVIHRMIVKIEQNLSISPDSLTPVLNRLKSIETRLKDYSSTVSKQLMADGADLHRRRTEIIDLEGVDVHNRIFEHSIPGDIDLYNCPDLKAMIQKQMEEGYRFVIFNMSKAHHIDSSAIGALIQIEGWLTRRGGSLIVTNLTDNVKKVFSLTRLESHIRVAATPEGAKETIEKLIEDLKNI
ncbi:MAG: VWA domain-containing protein [Leptospiraceae bacterium]|nr:VWA domain-containing protein [Leptospiraceae bacterium]MCK6382568.1 VWA domain-containing protein [Leptospiraceae bacterium]